MTIDLLGHCIVYSGATGKPPHVLKTWPLILSSTALTYNLAVSAAATGHSQQPSMSREHQHLHRQHQGLDAKYHCMHNANGVDHMEIE